MPNWTIKELDKYKIRIRTVNAKAFFGISELPEPTVDPIVLQNVAYPPDRDAEHLHLFFSFLHDTTQKDQPSFVDDFTYILLGPLLQLDRPLGATHSLTPFPFNMNGKLVKPVANVSVRRGEYYIIVVQRDTKSRDRAEPRLVAAALGAFCKDNEKRATKELAPMSSKMYIGIITIASAHFFYKITITQALVDAVRRKSKSPAEEIIIERFIPPVKDIDDFLRDGMLPLDNRRVIFQCYEALKELL